jgi:hypothetical protein
MVVRYAAVVLAAEATRRAGRVSHGASMIASLSLIASAGQPRTRGITGAGGGGGGAATGWGGGGGGGGGGGANR